jgi:quinolinate synthase
MGETAKILAPDKKVLIPYINSGCLLADMADVEELKKFKQSNNDYIVVSYVNTYAEIKAESDIICTSANANKIVEKVNGKKIVFIPDRNLGRYCTSNIDKDVVLWNGYCPVHEKITLQSIKQVKEKHKDAVVAVHPECPVEVTEYADFVGSTSQLIKFVKDSSYEKFIIGTEKSTLYVMKQKAPNKTLLLPEPEPICDQMKMITPERLIRCLEQEIYEIKIAPEIANRARKAIERMLEL